MNIFIKQNWPKILILVIVLVMIGGAFYWFALRPTKIKQDCSWVEIHLDAKPELTQEQHDNCVANSSGSGTFKGLFCDTPHPASPAQDWWQPTNTQQYDLCIREKGL